MRTKRQVVKYIKSQDWYPIFENEVKNQQNKTYTKFILEGNGFEGTISGAFLWHKTAEGSDVWEKRFREFKNWYNE